MSEGKHTPGPWFVGCWGGICRKSSHKGGEHPGLRGEDPCVYDPVRQEGFGGISADNGESVVSFYDDGVTDENARLIAAAPDMLEALEDVVSRLVEAFPEMKGYPPVLRAFAAISKATGVSPKVEDKPDSV